MWYSDNIYTTDRDNVARGATVSEVPLETDVDAPGDVPYGHLLHGLLDADLLELHKLGAAGLHVQNARVCVPAAQLARALKQGHERLPRDGLVDLALALVAGVGDDLCEGLHVGRSRHNPLHDNKLADVICTNKP